MDPISKTLAITSKIYLGITLAAIGCPLLLYLLSPALFSHHLPRYAVYISIGVAATSSAIMAAAGYVAYIRNCAFTRLSVWMMFMAHIILFPLAFAMLFKFGR